MEDKVSHLVEEEICTYRTEHSCDKALYGEGKIYLKGKT